MIGGSRPGKLVVALLFVLATAPLAAAAERASPERMCAVADCLADVVSMIEKQGWLGLELEGRPTGLRVREVVAGGPAAAAGLRANDFILTVGGERVDTKRLDTLQPLMARSRPGEVTELRIRRGDEERTVRVRAAKFPPERLTQAVGAYVLSAIHVCHHPDHQTFGNPPPGVGKPRGGGGGRR